MSVVLVCGARISQYALPAANVYAVGLVSESTAAVGEVV